MKADPLNDLGGIDACRETLENLPDCQRDDLVWNCLFVRPAWLKAWWQSFGQGREIFLRSFRRGDRLIGVAPLMVEGDGVRFMGDPQLCDYLDFTVSPGSGPEFSRGLLEHLRQEGIGRLVLEPVRADSVVMTDFLRAARESLFEVSTEPLGVTLEMDLPATWEDFLSSLGGKERHEIRRKFRRLEEAGPVALRVVQAPEAVDSAMEHFLSLFGRNRPDKAAFMTPATAGFFRTLVRALASEGMLRLFFLDLRGETAAAVLCFDDGQRVYLYNNAYDQRFGNLSVGLLSKVLSIRESIGLGRKTYDFLKGSEVYKYRLGGKPVPLHSCRIRLRSLERGPHP